MASQDRSTRAGSSRTPRGGLAVAVSAALIALTGLALSGAGPAGAVPPAGKGPGSTTTADAPTAPNPNADDDAVKDPCIPATDHSAENGSPKENDEPEQCTGPPAPPPPPAPVSVAVVEAATVPPAPVDLLPCGESITTDGKGIQPDVEVSRITDADKTSDDQCDAFPYDLKAVDRGLRFLKPNGYPFAQFFLDVEWRSDDGDITSPSYVDFELVKGGYAQTIPYCPYSIRDWQTGEVLGLTPDMDLTPAGLAALGIVDQDGLPGAEGAVDNEITNYACIISRTMKYVPDSTGPGHYRVLEKVYLLGDVFIRR